MNIVAHEYRKDKRGVDLFFVAFRFYVLRKDCVNCPKYIYF